MAISISISITQNSQSIVNNTSNVTFKVNASWTGGSYNKLQKSGWLKIDGTTYNFTSSFNENQTTTGSKTLFTKTLDIKHDVDGMKTVSCSASYTSGVSSGTVKASVNKTLTTIPRKSSMTASNGTLGTALTLTVSRAATSLTHTITYKCGNASGTICTKSSSTSVSWTPPLSLAKQNPTGTSVLVTFEIATYSGTTNVGYNRESISCTIPSSVKPSCTLTVTDPTGYSDIYGQFVMGLSKFKVVVNPTIAYGSPISTYKTTANSTTYTAASFTTGVLKNYGSLAISTTVTDKRGRSASATVNKSVINYKAPIINKLTVNRCNVDGTVTNDQGNYIKVTFSTTATKIEDINKVSYTLKYKKTSANAYDEVGLDEYENNFVVNDGYYIFEADTSSSYNIEMSATDNHNTTKKTTTASTGFTMLHFNVGGDGMGIGKISELPDVLDIGMKTRHYGGLLPVVLEPETDLNDVRTPNTYVGANISNYNYANCPLTSGTFSLEVIAQGEDGQVKQRLTYCHKTVSRVFERIYYSSSWGEWVCTSDWRGTLLATPGKYMTAGHIVNLSEPISKQNDGISLVFSLYSDGAVSNSEWVIRNVPKYMIINHPSGGGYSFECSTPFRNVIKYLYITDTAITGHDKNGDTITVGGVTYTNNSMVLRYVIGI